MTDTTRHALAATAAVVASIAGSTVLGYLVAGQTGATIGAGVSAALAPWLTEHFARRARKLVGEGS